MGKLDLAFTALDLMLEMETSVNFSPSVRKRAELCGITNYNNIEFSNLVRDWENGDIGPDAAAETLENLL